MNWDSINDFMEGAGQTFGTIKGILGEYGINVNGSGQSAGGTLSQPPGGESSPMNIFAGSNGIILLLVALVIIFLIMRR